MKPRSAKAKGKRLQNWLRDHLLQVFPLEKDDVRSTTMGDSGEDVQLSPAARKHIPFQIECKNKSRVSVYAFMEQAREHGPHEPLVVVKQDDSEPLVVVDAVTFFKLLKKANNNGSSD
jgi:hypothetical protein